MCDLSHANFSDVLHTWAPRSVYRGAMDNDGIHKFAYQHVAVFADLLRLAAPALAADLDFARAERLPASGVAPAGDRFEQRHGDLAWRVPHRRAGGKDGAHPQLIAVVEFQSTVDRDMARRMRDYCGMLRESQRRRRGGRGEGPSALLPLVVYNGSERWTAPGEAAALPSPWTMAAQLALAPFQAWDYVLLFLERLLAAGGGLARLPLANRSAATLRLQAERTPEGVLGRLRKEWARFPGEADRVVREALYAWAGALLGHMAGAESALPSVDELEGLERLERPTGGKEMATVSEARLGKWFDEVRAEHVALGVKQGMAEGIERERARWLARLRRHAAIKFGAGTAERLAALLGAAVAAEQMERVGDWIVECDHGEDLLARVTAMRANGGV